MSVKSPDFDIAICGGGMVGATLAALLVNDPGLSDLRIALIEARAPAPPQSDINIRVSAISRASQRILTRARAWQLLQPAQCAPYDDMVVWDAGGKFDDSEALHFSAGHLGEPDLGHIIANDCLQWAAWEAAGHERVAGFVAQLTGIALEAQAARITLADGRCFTARLVVGADGARSVSRSCVGINARVRPYPQTALVTHVHTERPHRRTAWQRFLPQGPIAFLPLNDGRSSIVWTTTHQHAETLLRMDETALARQIAQAVDHALGDVSIAAPRASFPLQLAQVDEYCRHRFVLVGDAAHSIHPLAGQGVNLGFMDAAALVQVLSDARQSGGLENLSELRVLRRYERWRKTENSLALGLVDGLNRLFSNDRQDAGRLRRAGMRLLQEQSFAKRLLMLRALGLAGEIPRMVRA